MPYTTKHLTELFNVADTTIRNWANEFQRHLSPLAKPAEGRHRQFSDEDLTAFSLIAEMKRQGQNYVDIHAALDAGQRGDVPEQNMHALLRSDHSKQIELLQERVMTLEEKTRQITADNAGLKANNDLLKSQLEAAQDEIKTLNREIGRLEAGKD